MKQIPKRKHAGGRPKGALDKRTSGEMALNRRCFIWAWTNAKPKDLTPEQQALLAYHRTLKNNARRGNGKMASVAIERAYGRLPQPLEHTGPGEGGVHVLEIRVNPRCPPV